MLASVKEAMDFTQEAVIILTLQMGATEGSEMAHVTGKWHSEPGDGIASPYSSCFPHQTMLLPKRSDQLDKHMKNAGWGKGRR